MPDFSKTPLTTDAEVEDWLHFYHANAPLICLRLAETWCFSGVNYLHALTRVIFTVLLYLMTLDLTYEWSIHTVSRHMAKVVTTTTM